VQQLKVANEQMVAVVRGIQHGVKDEVVSSVSLLDQKEIDLELEQRMEEMEYSETIEDEYWEQRTKEVFDENDLSIAHERDMEVLDQINAYEWITLDDYKADAQDRKWISLCWEEVRETSGELRSRRILREFASTAGEGEFSSPTPTVVSIETIHARALLAQHSLVYFDLTRAFYHAVETRRIYTQPPLGYHMDGWYWRVTRKIPELYHKGSRRCQIDPRSDELIAAPYLGRWRYRIGSIIFKKIDSRHVVRFHCSREGETRALTIELSSYDCNIFVESNWKSCATTVRSTDCNISFLFGIFIQNLYAEVFRQLLPSATYTDSSAGSVIATRYGTGHAGHLEVRELYVQQLKATECIALCQTERKASEADTDTKVSIERAVEKVCCELRVGLLYLVRQWLGT